MKMPNVCRTNAFSATEGISRFLKKCKQLSQTHLAACAAFICFPLVSADIGCSKIKEVQENQEKTKVVKKFGNEFIKEMPPVFTDEVDALDCYFPVLNSTRKKLEFKEIRTSCGCSSATLEKMNLLPNQGTILHLKVNLRGRTGPLHFSCQLVTDMETVFNFNVNTIGNHRFQFEPSHVFFGFIKPNQELIREATIKFYPNSKTDINPATELRTDSSQIKVELLPTEVGPSLSDNITPAITKKCRITLLPQKQGGMGSSEVIAVYKGFDGTEKECRLSVTWIIPELYVVTPKRAFFGNRPNNSPNNVKIAIRRTDGKPFSIRQIKSTDTRVKVAILKGGPSDGKLITITADCIPKEESFSGEAFLETDDPDEPWIKIPFAAFSKANK